MKPENIALALKAQLMLRVGGCPFKDRLRDPRACDKCFFLGTHLADDLGLRGWNVGNLWACERKLLRMMKSEEKGEQS